MRIQPGDLFERRFAGGGALDQAFPSGSGWFLARCSSKTAACSTIVGYASTPPNDAKGA